MEERYLENFRIENYPRMFEEVPQDFIKRTLDFELEIGFEIFNLLKKQNMSDKNEEILRTMLYTNESNLDGCIQKLVDEDICFTDLSSLTDNDLQVLGFQDPTAREELLQFLQVLPRQAVSFECIRKQPFAQSFNKQILSKAKDHLKKISSALEVSQLVLQMDPPRDLFVGEKYFASRYTIEALNQLTSLAKDMDANAKSLQEFRDRSLNYRKSQRKPWKIIVLWVTAPAVIIGSAYLVFRIKK